MSEQHVHCDPEFETFTCGDPTTPMRLLRYLRPGDFLVFYWELQERDATDGRNRVQRSAQYLAGYIEVILGRMAHDFDPNTLGAESRQNFHVRYPSISKRQKDALVLVRGEPRSRLFGKADQTNGKEKDRVLRPLRILSPSMRKVIGDPGGHVSIQRRSPGWVEPTFVDRAMGYLKDLD